ncbi:hypothetical protein [Salarchaeum japonicum]|uniref:DUF308 domain-containing protein n=1 Tax=Salarchaeum japonicum TaxID=555573 RepID=A0AAV3SXV6_9EURY|nr:hypothetical protein [Salarchaeum japonicum]
MSPPPTTRYWLSFSALGLASSVAGIVFNLGPTVLLVGVVLILGGAVLAVAQRRGASRIVMTGLLSGISLGLAAVTFWGWTETRAGGYGWLTVVFVAGAVLIPLQNRYPNLSGVLIPASFGVLVVYAVLQQNWILAAVSAIVTVVLARQTIQQRRERVG